MAKTSRIKLKWFGPAVFLATREEAIDIVERITAVIFEQCKQAVAVDTGALKESGLVEKRHTAKAARTRILFGGKTAPYAVPHEAEKPYLWPSVRNQKGKLKK